MVAGNIKQWITLTRISNKNLTYILAKNELRQSQYSGKHSNTSQILPLTLAHTGNR